MCFLCVLRVVSENVVPPQIHTCLSHVFPETPVLGTAWDPNTLHRGKKWQTDRGTKNTVPLEHLQGSQSLWELFSTPCWGKSSRKLMLAKIAALPESLSIRNSSGDRFGRVLQSTLARCCKHLVWWQYFCLLFSIGLHRSGHLRWML